jgi:hypothetical protein
MPSPTPEGLPRTSDQPPGPQTDHPAGEAGPAAPPDAGRQTTRSFRDPDATATYRPDPEDGRPEATAEKPGEPPPEIPGYEVLGVLGRGGMGVVYKARHLALKRPVALKMILAGAHAGDQERSRFRTEAEAAARLQHPNIVQVYEVGEHHGLPFCALEFVDGGSLSRKLRGRPLPAKEAARLVATLADAMHLAHSRNVVHRDLKPANVLLTRDGTPKIADFGLARRLDEESGQTHTGTVMGTPSYMAPEQASGQAHAAGPAADVYALGAILYASLTGRPPFQGANAVETLDQVRHQEPVAPRLWQPDVPRDLETICSKCLRKQPEQRYSSARELGDDLGRFLRGEPIAARPVGRLERLRMWVWRRPVVAALWAAVVVLAVAGGGVSGWFWLDAQAARVNEADTRTRQAEERIRYALAEKQHDETEKQLLKQNQQDTEDHFAKYLVKTLNHQGGPLNPSEVDPLWELAAAGNDRIPRRFFELGLEADVAARLAWRAEWVVQAGVGLNPRRRDEVRALVLARLQDKQKPLAVRLACVELGVALAARDESFAQAASRTLAESMVQAPDLQTLERQASRVVGLTGRLGPKQAAEAAAEATLAVLDALAQTSEPSNRYLLARPLAHLAGRLAPEAAAAAAAKVLDVMGKTADPSPRAALALALGQLADRLAPGQKAEVAAKALGLVLDGIILPVNPIPSPNPLVGAVQNLAGRLTPQQVVRAAEQALGLMTRTADPTARNNLAQAIGPLVERLPTEDALAVLRKSTDPVALLMGGATQQTLGLLAAQALANRRERLTPGQADGAARQVLAVLARTTDPIAVASLTQSVGQLAGRLGPEQSAEVAAAASRRVLDTMARAAEPTAQPPAWVLPNLGYALANLADRLTPEGAAEVSGQVLKVLGKTTDPLAQSALAHVLAKLADRLAPPEAAEAAARAVPQLLDTLGKSPKGPLNPNLANLAVSVGPLAGRLEPEQAAQAVRQALDVLARVPDPNLSNLARGVGPLAKRLTPQQGSEAAEQALDALDRTTDPTALDNLAEAVVQLTERLDPEASRKAAARATQRLVLATVGAPNPHAVRTGAQAVARLADRLPPEQAAEVSARIARHAQATLAKTTEVWSVGSLASALGALAERLPPEQAAGAARQLLAAMPRYDNWTVLGQLAGAVDRLGERLPPEEAARAARQAIAALARTADKNTAAFLAQAVEHLAKRLPPDKAAEAAQQALAAMARTSDPSTLFNLAEATGKLTKRLAPAQAGEVTAKTARRLLTVLARVPDPVGLPTLQPLGTLDEQRRAITQDFMSSTLQRFNTRAEPFVLAEAVAKLLDGLPLEQAARAVQPVLDTMATTNNVNALSTLAQSMEKVAERSGTQGLVDLLKLPTCTGRAREAVLRELARRVGPPPHRAAAAAGAVAALPSSPLSAAALLADGDAIAAAGRRPFTDVWEAVDWLREHHPQLDLASPPRRLDR